VTAAPEFQPRLFAPPLEHLAKITEDEFRAMFRDSPVTRSRYAGFLRNVAIAMGNSGQERFRAPLERLAQHSDAMVREHARWALEQVPFGPPATMKEWGC
jgi:epoxyqueuosine reductase